jgi:hypothetical protein
MNIMRAFERVDRLQVHHLADDVIRVDDTVAAVHVARRADRYASCFSSATAS